MVPVHIDLYNWDSTVYNMENSIKIIVKVLYLSYFYIINNTIRKKKAIAQPAEKDRLCKE